MVWRRNRLCPHSPKKLRSRGKLPGNSISNPTLEPTWRVSIEPVHSELSAPEERAQIQNKLIKLDQAIAVIRGLAGTPTPNGHPKKSVMSASARRKIAKAQKLRWAKLRAQQKG